MTKEQKIELTLNEIYCQAKASTLTGTAREYEYVRLKRIAEENVLRLGGDWPMMAETVCGRIYDLL